MWFSSLHNDRVADRQHFPVWVRGAQGSSNRSRLQVCTVIKYDTAAERNAPALIARLGLPGGSQPGLGLSVIVEDD
jgi:hypothetical protein